MGTPEDKAPRPCVSNLIWVLSSDPICQFNQLFLNSEAAMLSLLKTRTPIASLHTLIFQIFSLLSYYFSSTTDISLPPNLFFLFPLTIKNIFLFSKYSLLKPVEYGKIIDLKEQ